MEQPLAKAILNLQNEAPRMFNLVKDIASALNDKKGKSEDKLSIWETSLLLECETIINNVKS